ncbi:hypothetical protein CONLIGDRAFT_240939 [Coniochaeta ligniaria NRRL 30616]|uniref:Uncharacterized protein n=1 Tax=Coniochaeta ligniaria NRRL 30616 TaxID=1408157 RepID=A0A1J7JEN4_9PEZI|nr:hypothetical protein CONLIGDRAFT_240939 [Coniochaeta ligniaria NRRL 30616]
MVYSFFNSSAYAMKKSDGKQAFEESQNNGWQMPLYYRYCKDISAGWILLSDLCAMKPLPATGPGTALHVWSGNTAGDSLDQASLLVAEALASHMQHTTAEAAQAGPKCDLQTYRCLIPCAMLCAPDPRFPRLTGVYLSHSAVLCTCTPFLSHALSRRCCLPACWEPRLCPPISAVCRPYPFHV